jgi:drug/metabolite transporter (DMT)-like permease
MHPTKGASLILISAFFYGTYGIWSHLMSDSFGEFSQAWTRGLFLLIVITLVNLKFHIFKPLVKKDLPWLGLIAIAGGLNQAPYFFGFKHLNIGTATLFFYASLVIGGYLLGKIVFREQLTPVKIISLALAVAGMLSIYQLNLTSSQLLPAILTTIAGFMGSATVIVPKKLVGGYPEFQIMVGYFVVQVIANGLLSLLFHNSIPTLSQPISWLAQLGYALSMLFANWAAIEGYRHFDASIGSLIGLAEILFGVFFGILLFNESLSLGIIVGGLLILISASLPHLKPLNPLKMFLI